MSRIVIAGSRGFDDYEPAKEYIRKSLKLLNTEDVIILSGGCYGADLLGERFAAEMGYEIERYPAQWEVYGRKAGIKRNEEMVKIADAVICFWDGKSKGTRSTIKFAEQMGKPLFVKRIDSIL